MENVVTTQGVRTEVKKGQILVSRLYKSDYQKEGTMTAELKQEIITKSFYPSKQVATNLQQNIFGAEEFGFKDQEFESKETRVAWLDVPANYTEEQVKQRIAQAEINGACLYKILSNRPIISESQQYAINNNQRTLAEYANTQIVRYPEGTIRDGINVGGQIALHNEKPQYRRNFFWASPKEDQDMRTTDPADYFISAELQSELSGATIIPGQQVF
jgi:hypothetical protein